MLRIPVHVRVEHPGDVRRALARGARRFEVALRPGSLAEADYRIARIRARTGPHAPLGIDASEARWDPEEARRALARLAAYAPAWVVDPVPPPRLAELGPSPVPIVVDLVAGGPSPADLHARGAAGVLVRAGAPSDLIAAARAAGLARYVVSPAALLELAPFTLLLRAPAAALDLHQGDLVLPTSIPSPGAVPVESRAGRESST